MSRLIHVASAALLVSAFIALFASTKTPVQIEIGRLINVYTPSSPPYVGAFSLLLSISLLLEGYPRLKRRTYIHKLESLIPEMVKSFQSAFATGLTMIDAARLVAESNLSPMNQLFRDALRRYETSGNLSTSMLASAASTGSRKLSSAMKLIIAAYDHGAGAETALDALYRSLLQLREYENQKRSHLGQYVAIVYVMVLIFSLVASIVVVGFIPQLQSIKTASSPFAQGIGAQGLGLTVPSALSIIQFISIIISIFAGLIIGKLINGDHWSGLTHSAILILISLAIYEATPLLSSIFVPV